MALRFNGFSPTGANPWSAMCSKQIGNVTGVGANNNLRTQYGNNGDRMNQRYAFGALASTPNACEHPTAWIMAEQGGDLAAENTINEGNTVTLTSLSLGKDLSCALVQDGSITAAALSMIASLACNLQNEGQLTGPLQMTLNMAANMVQDGQVDAALGLIAWISASMTQDADMSATNLRGTLSMAANIVSYGELTPEGLRDAVWSAILANYPDAGTAGKTLALAGAGGVDYTALGVAVWSSVSRTLTAGAAPSTDDIVAAIEAAIVSVNVKQVNDVAVTGTGATGDEWGPA